MDSLDEFRQSWEHEIQSKQEETELSCQPTGDLCHIGKSSNSKRRHEDDEEYVSGEIVRQNIILPNPKITITTASFTIGIQNFTIGVSSSETTNHSEIHKKVKKSEDPLLIDQLIQDIDEITDIPFFNNSLPREIGLKIFEHLSINDLYSCLLVCRAWNSLSSDDLLWCNIYKHLKLRSRTDLDHYNWKDHVKDAVLFDREIQTNFRNHQCRTSTLTYRIGHILTCMNRDPTTIVAGYSTGIIRTWPVKCVLDTDDSQETEEQINHTPDIIYESCNIDPNSDLNPVQSVGLLGDSIYAIHDDGFLEVWHKGDGKKPYFTQKLTTSKIDQTNDDGGSRICVSTSLKFHTWNLPKAEYQMLDFFSEYNDTLLSFATSSDHGVPISLLAGEKSLWCVSLKDMSHRFAFYSLLPFDYIPSISIDIRNDEPIAAISLSHQMKLFDLESGRCNVLSNDYHSLPADVRLIRAKNCPRKEFAAAFENCQISVFDERVKQGAVQHFYGHHGSITSIQMDTWKLASSDSHGYVRLWLE